MTSPWRGALVVLALGAAGCVESATHDKTVAELQRAHQASWGKDQRLAALEWQMAALTQRLQSVQQRGAAVERELGGQVEALKATNVALAERLKNEESLRASLAAAAEEPRDAAGRGRPRPAATRLSAEDLRRLQALIEVRNAPLVEALARIEKLLHGRAAPDPGAVARPDRPRGPAEVVDPWGFRKRK